MAKSPAYRTHITSIAKLKAQRPLLLSSPEVGGTGAMSSCVPSLPSAEPCPPLTMPPARLQPLGRPCHT
ncbi:hypothetical protein ANANG_G00191900 [Anguilla anguilla]|uniref:Uncharacterized protein n=1 Tax=Anguilla anguilla TaxID=7936 RepID=A0A9D3M308_ANGAN|nr:hypothetical protein ANANG_G00191900 [Anguilla anguilla]